MTETSDISENLRFSSLKSVTSNKMEHSVHWMRLKCGVMNVGVLWS